MAGLRFRDKRVETVKDGRKYFDLNNRRVGIDKREGIWERRVEWTELDRHLLQHSKSKVRF